ncbi:hypothetical protein RB595_008735 [Gaeumannomyces hyphopodioides]
MVTLDIPNSYALSPSPATPHLTINHDVAQDLDSTNAFEGPEKLLEVWFAPSPSSLPPGAKPHGLKAVPSANWVEMLDMVNCKILSVVQSDAVDAYLLSESSMFVFPHKIILKTCGTTTLLLGLYRLLRIAAVDGGFPVHNATSLEDVKAAATPYRVFYSRKNFLFPDRQQGPHRSWKQEVKYLDDLFEGGSAYMVGKMNGDHWYLYITSPNTSALTPPRTPPQTPPESPLESAGGAAANASASASASRGGAKIRIPAGIINAAPGVEEDDETLEILMTDLDPERAKQFYLSHASAVACEQVPLRAQEARQSAHDSLGELSGEPMFDVEDVGGPGAAASAPANDEAMVAEALTTEGHALGTVVSDACGLSDVYPKSKYPDARIDAYMFAPCGFSANGVIPSPQTADVEGGSAGHYFTVHVTPEPNCSYASFETNVPHGQNGRDVAEIIDHVVRIFRPGRFSITLFEGKGRRAARSASGSSSPSAGSLDEHGLPQLKRRVDCIPGYRRIDRIVHDFDDYDLIFRYYERDGWVGDGVARVGEED